MIRNVGRAQMIGIAAILTLFFLAEFAVRDGLDARPMAQAQASNQR
jgi:hypothetical protein